MAERIVVDRVGHDGSASRLVASTEDGAGWTVRVGREAPAGPLTRARMWRRVGALEPWTLTSFSTSTEALRLELMGRLSFLPFEDEDEDDERTWYDIDLPDPFGALIHTEQFGLRLDTEQHPFAIDGQLWIRHNDVLCPVGEDGDLFHPSPWHVYRQNNSASRTYGPDDVLLLGPIPPQGHVLIHTTDPDIIWEGDDRAWAWPARSRAASALALIDRVSDEVGSAYEWQSTRSFEAIALMTALDPDFKLDVDAWAIDGYGSDADDEELVLALALGPDDVDELCRLVARRRGRRFVDWIVKGRPPANGLTHATADIMLSQMRRVRGEPGVYQTPGRSGLPDRLRRIDGALTEMAWVRCPAAGGTDEEPGREEQVLYRARCEDAAFATIDDPGAEARVRAIRCRWDHARDNRRADDRFLAWFLRSAVRPDDLFDPGVDWQLPVGASGEAHRRLDQLIDRGIRTGLWQRFLDDDAVVAAKRRLRVPAPLRELPPGRTTKAQRVQVLEALQRWQRVRGRGG
jgi:hypothetical protein